MATVRASEELAIALFRIANDPERTEAVYRILGEYCHQARNRLNSLKLSLYLARRLAIAGDMNLWKEIDRRYAACEQFFDQLQTILRPMRLVPIQLDLGRLIEEWLPEWIRRLGARGIDLEAIPPLEPVLGSFDPQRIARGLDALISWRAAAARTGSRIQLTWWSTDNLIYLSWREPDAEGLEDDSGDLEGAADLALPLLMRVVSAHSGMLELRLDSGLHLDLKWPREVDATA
ncbi:MAG: HAMP domain-containing histidine kinase [Isosphaeraceae bacterium]|nr:HAMP domain-containing histidine kinase [Isosphaeraceae bacterium]